MLRSSAEVPMMRSWSLRVSRGRDEPADRVDSREAASSDDVIGRCDRPVSSAWCRILQSTSLMVREYLSLVVAFRRVLPCVVSFWMIPSTMISQPLVLSQYFSVLVYSWSEFATHTSLERRGEGTAAD